MKEKKAVSEGLSLAIVLKFAHSGIPARSSPMHSKYSRAPCFIHIFLPICAIFLYSAILLLGTGITNPSTYDIRWPPLLIFKETSLPANRAAPNHDVRRATTAQACGYGPIPGTGRFHSVVFRKKHPRSHPNKEVTGVFFTTKEHG